MMSRGRFRAPQSSGVLGLVQFSRSTEATNGVLPPASLKTEQRLAPTQAWCPFRARAIQVRSTFRDVLPRKEVIQPQLPLRLPCYDFTPITSPTFDGSLP